MPVDLRYVRLGRVELVRRIYAAVRDQNWNTIPGVVSDYDVDAREDSFTVRFAVRHTNPEIDFSWVGAIVGTPEGLITFSLDGNAGVEFVYNRIGFCVLHPWRESSGASFRGQASDGPVEGTFPQLIGPQKLVDGHLAPLFPPVSRLEIDLSADTTAIYEFDGDLFECEDQRNWTDASFKTYCTPLSLGLPHHAASGTAIAQTVKISARGRASSIVEEESPRIELGAATGKRMPPVGLVLPPGVPELSDSEANLLATLAPGHLRLQLHLAQPTWPDELERATKICKRLGAGVELMIFLREEQGGQLASLAERLAGVPVARVLVAPEDAKSITPDETTPAALVRLVRDSLGLSNVPVAGGTDMYFCELNRTRPDVEAMDGLFWSVNPQVHAFDDISLVETPEAQAEQVRSAMTISGGKPAFVGPITFKRRYNVNAVVAEPDDAPDELPDSVDRRQASLLGSAWTAASAKYLAEAGAGAATYFEVTGWRGVIQGDKAPSDERFPAQVGQVFPLYHVLTDLARWRNAELLDCTSNRPLDVVGLAVRDAEGSHMLVANLTPRSHEVTVTGLPVTVDLRRLNLETVQMASFDSEQFRAERLRVIAAVGGLRLELAPYETIRIDGSP